MHQIGRLNSRGTFASAGVSWHLRKGCCSSWIEIRVAEPPDDEVEVQLEGPAFTIADDGDTDDDDDDDDE